MKVESLHMRAYWFRRISALVLFATATMFSGLFSIIPVERSITNEANGNHCNKDAAQSCPLACTTPVCPLCICVLGDAVRPIEVRASFQIAELNFLDLKQSPPTPYVDEIFHPPKLSKPA